jgi:hypothetical protein
MSRGLYVKTGTITSNFAIFILYIQDIIAALTDPSSKQHNQDAQSLLEILSAADSDSIKILPDNSLPAPCPPTS